MRQPPPPPPAPPTPATKALDEVREAVERERGALVGRCWDALAPEDRGDPARVKVIADVDPSGRVGEWQAFEIPEMRRPELTACIQTVLDRAALTVPAPGASVKAAATVQFP